jgi:hypothetical protein
MTDNRDVTTGKRPKVGIVREWTIALGVLTAGNMTRVEAEMKLRAYVPLLLENFPPGAFTQDSLHFVASQCKWFPSYAEVIEHLRAWWHDNRPHPIAIAPPPPPPETPPPTPEQVERVHSLVREFGASLYGAPLYVEPPSRPTPSYLPADVLDEINPLPGGRKRHVGTD